MSPEAGLTGRLAWSHSAGSSLRRTHGLRRSFRASQRNATENLDPTPPEFCSTRCTSRNPATPARQNAGLSLNPRRRHRLPQKPARLPPRQSTAGLSLSLHRPRHLPLGHCTAWQHERGVPAAQPTLLSFQSAREAVAYCAGNVSLAPSLVLRLGLGMRKAGCGHQLEQRGPTKFTSLGYDAHDSSDDGIRVGSDLARPKPLPTYVPAAPLVPGCPAPCGKGLERRLVLARPRWRGGLYWG